MPAPTTRMRETVTMPGRYEPGFAHVTDSAEREDGLS
jgi:hypothetical protein